MADHDTKAALPTIYGHYYKNVSNLTHVDVYRVLDLFHVTRPAVAHAVKKLLVAGQRGSKTYEADIAEAAASLQRELELLHEDRNGFMERRNSNV